MSHATRGPRWLLAVAIGLAMLLMAETVVLAVATTKTGGAVRAVKVVTEGAHHSITSSGFTNIPGMSTSVTVPSGQKALLLITFSASATCTTSGEPTFCIVRVLVHGSEALPNQVVFDTSYDGNSPYSFEANSMQFVAGPVSAGPHSIRVQARIDTASSKFELSSRTLSVLRSTV